MSVSLPPQSPFKDSPKSRSSQRAEDTREAILKAAELRFAAKGFYPTRLEDIADDVGITRTAVIYHFKDKEALYNAVLETLFTQLDEVISFALSADAPFLEKIEGAVTAWVQYAGKRPTLMRLFMREVAGSEEGLRQEVSRYVDPMFGRLIAALEEGKKQKLCRDVDAVQFWSILAGATMFFIMDAPLLAKDGFNQVSYQASVDAYNRELIRVIHGLLGVNGSGV
jgi:TetR/AcrR family transcriptional regulator